MLSQWSMGKFVCTKVYILPLIKWENTKHTSGEKNYHDIQCLSACLEEWVGKRCSIVVEEYNDLTKNSRMNNFELFET